MALLVRPSEFDPSKLTISERQIGKQPYCTMIYAGSTNFHLILSEGEDESVAAKVLFGGIKEKYGAQDHDEAIRASLDKQMNAELTAEKAAFVELIDVRIKECLLEKFESYFPDKPGSTKKTHDDRKIYIDDIYKPICKKSSKEKYNPFITLSVSMKSPPEFAVCKWNEKKGRPGKVKKVNYSEDKTNDLPADGDSALIWFAPKGNGVWFSQGAVGAAFRVVKCITVKKGTSVENTFAYPGMEFVSDEEAGPKDASLDSSPLSKRQRTVDDLSEED